MSLKAFHLFFIAVSTLLVFGFGVWGIYTYLMQEGMTYLVLGLLALVTGVILIVYGLRFLHKIRHATYL